MTLTIIFLVLAIVFVLIGIKFVRVMKNAFKASPQDIENAKNQRAAHIEKLKNQGNANQNQPT